MIQLLVERQLRIGERAADLLWAAASVTALAIATIATFPLIWLISLFSAFVSARIRSRPFIEVYREWWPSLNPRRW